MSAKRKFDFSENENKDGSHFKISDGRNGGDWGVLRCEISSQPLNSTVEVTLTCQLKDCPKSNLDFLMEMMMGE